MTRCYLVRHAQTAWNLENRLQGRSDLPLHPTGHVQARHLGAYFAPRHLRGIFTSHLLRSQQTASAIASGNGHGTDPVLEPDLAEIHLGAWEGLTPEEVDARFGGAYRRWRAAPSKVEIPEAEPTAAFLARAQQALRRLLRGLEGEGEYVVVTHGGVIAACLADLLGADYDALLRRLRLDNAGITALDVHAAGASVAWINATGHLTAPPAGAP
jgi:broad specificity phosphatase PhoE